MGKKGKAASEFAKGVVTLLFSEDFRVTMTSSSLMPPCENRSSIDTSLPVEVMQILGVLDTFVLTSFVAFGMGPVEP